MKLYQKLILFLNVAVIIATILSYLSPQISPTKTAFFAIFGLAFPWLIFANVLFILVWAINKPPYMLLSIICLAIGFNNIDKFFGTHGIQDDRPNKKELTVATFNMQLSSTVVYIKDTKEKEKETKKYLKFLESFRDVDVFCGQEMGVYSHKWLKGTNIFKHIHRIEDKSTAIYSKYPIVASGEIDFGTNVNSCVWADIQFNDEVVRVYSAHLQSNRISGKESQIIEAGKWEKETFTGLKDMFSKYQQHSATRASQAQMIRKHSDKSGKPFIICGDFNDPPQSYVYKTIARDLNDSFRCAGSGIGTSFNGVIPALRIDYILSDEAFDIYTHKIIRTGESDHYPLISLLALP